jgi:hypothetical protein
MSNVTVIEPRAEAAPSLPAAATPLAMLSQAVERGASVEVLEKLMALHERWEANQARKSFDAAISEAKSKIKPVVKNRQGHNSGYADFAAIAAVVDPIISDHGLSYRFRTKQADKIAVTCILSHRDGHSEETTLCGPADKSGSKNDIQAIGSTLTYLQRYTLVQALGLSVTNDDDGRATGNSDAITDEQADSIRDLLSRTNANVDKFLEMLKVECIPDIPAARYDYAIGKLNQKLAAMEREAAQ